MGRAGLDRPPSLMRPLPRRSHPPTSMLFVEVDDIASASVPVWAILEIVPRGYYTANG
jgi:hypothetical protein